KMAAGSSGWISKAAARTSKQEPFWLLLLATQWMQHSHQYPTTSCALNKNLPRYTFLILGPSKAGFHPLANFTAADTTLTTILLTLCYASLHMSSKAQDG